MSESRSESPDSNDDEETPLEMIVGGITMALIFTVAFGLLALGIPWFWIAFPVGFAGLLPAAIGLTKLYERRQSESTNHSNTTNKQDALKTLRERYARGELSDEEFERRLDALLETESVSDATVYMEREKARE
jgi:uncharacterized membrane protein